MEQNILDVMQDERYSEFLVNLPDQYQGEDYTNRDGIKKGKVLFTNNLIFE